MFFASVESRGGLRLGQAAVVLVVGCVTAAGDRQGKADERATERALVATVLGWPITMDQLRPVDAELQQHELSKEEYQKWLLQNRTRQLFVTALGQILRDYARREKLKPSDDEIDALLNEAVKKRLADGTIDAAGRQKLANLLPWAQASAREWRTAKALYEKYGGRVTISSFGGCQSFEGRNAVLKDYAARGDLKFHNAELEQAFWEKSRDERIGDVTLAPERVADHFARPPWEHFQRVLAAETQGQPPPEP